nr:MAG TPA: hypothetical protein [Bacteriophage sp.]
MINPMQLMQMLRGGNPQQVLMNLLNQQAGNNPVMKNALDMVQRGDTKGVEQLARNMANEKGIDVDKAVAEIRKQLGM